MARRTLLRVATLGLFSGLAAFLVGEFGWLACLDARAYDMALRTRPPLPQRDRVAVVEIDDAAIARLGRWPWPWSQHERFVRTLHEHYHPAVIVFDLLFSEADPSDKEGRFASAVREAGNVYLAASLSSLPEADEWTGEEEIPWQIAEYTGEPNWRGSRFCSVHPPTRDLALAAAGIGPVNVVPEIDGCIRRLPLVIEHEGQPHLSLMGVVLNAIVNPDRRPVRVNLGRTVDFGGYSVPIDDCGETLVSYTSSTEGRLRETFPHYRYDAVLLRETHADALRDKVVFVGSGATGLGDVHPTPVATGALGVDINAHALNGLLNGSFLKPAGWPARLALALALALLTSLAATAWSPGRALAGSLVIAALGLLLVTLTLWSRGIWLGAAMPGLAILVAYTTTVAQRHRDSERDSLRTRASVDILAHATRLITAARARSELLDEIRAQVTDAMAARQTNLYLMDQEQQRLILAFPADVEREPVAYAVGEGTVGWVAEHSVIHLVRELDADSLLAQELARAAHFSVGSVAYAPMRRRGEVIGVIEVVRGVGEAPFEERHLPMLDALASEVAVALENMRLYEQLQGKVEIANRQLVAAYADLREERDRVAAIVSNMADGVLLTDRERRIVFLNPAAAAMFGVDAKDAEGQPISEALPHPTLLEQLADELPEVTARIPRIHLDQPRRLVLSPRTVWLTDGEGGRIGAVTVVSDITLLEELSEMKTEFVSLVSHELRTPLTSIMGFAQTLTGDAGRIGPEEREEFLGIIEQESNRLLVMINDLLDISRMEAGRTLTINYGQVDLLRLAEHVVRFQQVTTTAHRFLFEFPEGGISVEADRDKVEQIVTNLVSNAIKYSPRGGDVVVGASGPADAGEEVVLFVRDQGLGMDAEQIAQLFQRYQRVDRDAIKGIRGTGLGLYLVRGLVEAHGGRIWAESEPGRGSTFYFSLPTRRPERESGA